MKEKLSVIIPTLNEEKYLPRLLGDLKRQTYNRFEIIVADSNSEDDTKKVARRFDCDVINCKREGPARGRNVGAEEAQGDYILFLDADVRIPADDFLERVVDKVEKERIELATFKFKHVNGKKIDDLAAVLAVYLLKNFADFFPHSPGFCIFVSREIHDKLGGFREDLKVAEDHNYVKRASRFATLKVILDPSIRIYARRQEKEGRLNLLKKYFLCMFYRMLNGEMTKEIYKYEFGSF